jgi:hypothetical protein
VYHVLQILFLLYHYYEAKEVYNAIRLFIAAYVWMTGFGNFIYYYKTNDFSVGRFAQMMWRLNFLVTFACIVLRNSYMLYYICPMHTIFTVSQPGKGRVVAQLVVITWLLVPACTCSAYLQVLTTSGLALTGHGVCESLCWLTLEQVKHMDLDQVSGCRLRL